MYIAWRDHHITPSQFMQMSEGEKTIILAFEEYRQKLLREQKTIAR